VFEINSKKGGIEVQNYYNVLFTTADKSISFRVKKADMTLALPAILAQLNAIIDSGVLQNDSGQALGVKKVEKVTETVETMLPV
jgi:hypothetical protein